MNNFGRFMNNIFSKLLFRVVFFFLPQSVCFEGFASMQNPGVEKNQSFVIGEMTGQLGNQLFVVAAASALAWDNNAEAYFPTLISPTEIYKHVFFRCKLVVPNIPIDYIWQEPRYGYDSIPFCSNMQIRGYFQSEKYFVHHREKILQLLAPSFKDMTYFRKKYDWLIQHPNTVGVQLRYYYLEIPGATDYMQYGMDYLEKAMSLFPEDSLFVVTTNNVEHTRKSMPKWAKNVVFLEEPHYMCLHLQSLCKHNIISNSTFGWWGAWLNKNPNKIVVCPSAWMNGLDVSDTIPQEWIQIDAKYECPTEFPPSK